MSDSPPLVCNYTDPISVVESFIVAMNQWETAACQAAREARHTADPSSHWGPVQNAMDCIFSLYCTARERPHGRHSSFSKPPQYNPANEHVISSLEHGKKWHVETQRDHPLYGGKLLYVMQKVGGEWRIDSVKIMQGATWRPTTL
ncbi:NTF2 fold immunity protein [Chitinivorax sp. B]|uniref:NTF2 fold immunity protein n=1 Tax=Chitinivorax sp. B TaxID=2502235 RepID=UPI0014852DEA|nr:NTF2 fold immunity protein [Chitinivorax sp. B]